MFAAGDAAGVPDPSRPGRLTPMTAQHAQRQGKVVARNLAAGERVRDRFLSVRSLLDHLEVIRGIIRP